MKNAEDICKELNWTFDSDPSRYNLFVGLVKPDIKLAQLNAVEETCKYVSGKMRSYTDESIALNCADILKKELE